MLLRAGTQPDATTVALCGDGAISLPPPPVMAVSFPARCDSSGEAGLPNVDDALRAAIAERHAADPDYWTFSYEAQREGVHAYFRYPAMMVPKVQRELLGLILRLQPTLQSALDPFVGSGTVLNECMYSGLDSRGHDTNPLAILVCQAKTGPFQIETLRARWAEVKRAVDTDGSDRAAVDFRGITKWFRPEAITELSRLHRAIRAVPERWVRRFLWVTLAETVRVTSNSRTSTVKLHIRPPAEIEKLSRPRAAFEELVVANIDRTASFAQALVDRGHLVDGAYRGTIQCRLQDSRNKIDGIYDLLMTSPPYGDNTSTIPYGQHAYLPLQWIDLQDIGEILPRDPLASTYEIDNWALGGILLRGRVREMCAELIARSPTLRALVDALEQQPRDRLVRVLTFVRDLNACLPPIVAALRENAYMLWTVGNRRVGGHQVPLDRILIELLTRQQVAHVATIDRRIPSKRMATRNNVSTSTIRSERILIFRKEAREQEVV